ncbi:unnamed protein product [Nezara viridula]|uniref:PPAF-2-like Clip domain-containing protein n=1 Tax=Nezara viridula TaxID=85310 RepID=A0A9P0HA19_NEZVI|nr:unnamed protein product [Nezara viridula]
MSAGWKVLLFFVGLCCCVAGQQQECECVEYFLCSESHGTIITDGTNLLDVRSLLANVYDKAAIPSSVLRMLSGRSETSSATLHVPTGVLKRSA